MILPLLIEREVAMGGPIHSKKVLDPERISGGAAMPSETYFPCRPVWFLNNLTVASDHLPLLAELELRGS
jgi:hypothetical protein